MTQNQEYKKSGRSRKIHFTQISNELICNPELSGKDKWILIYLLSKPEGWTARTGDIAKHTADGESAIRSGLLALRKSGYVQLYKLIDGNGRVKKWITTFSDQPVSWYTSKIIVVTDEQFNAYEIDCTATPDKDILEAGIPLVEEPQKACPDVDSPDVDFPDVVTRNLYNNKDLTNKDLTNKESRNTREEAARANLSIAKGGEDKQPVNQANRSSYYKNSSGNAAVLEEEPPTPPTPPPPVEVAPNDLPPLAQYMTGAEKQNERLESKGRLHPWQKSARRLDYDDDFVRWYREYVVAKWSWNRDKKLEDIMLGDVKGTIGKKMHSELGLTELYGYWETYQQINAGKAQKAANIIRNASMYANNGIPVPLQYRTAYEALTGQKLPISDPIDDDNKPPF